MVKYLSEEKFKRYEFSKKFWFWSSVLIGGLTIAMFKNISFSQETLTFADGIFMSIFVIINIAFWIYGWAETKSELKD